MTNSRREENVFCSIQIALPETPPSKDNHHYNHFCGLGSSFPSKFPHTYPEVEPTNNISERELRKLVMQLKISNGSRSVAGAETIAVLYSVVETLKHQNKPVFPGLKDILTSES